MGLIARETGGGGFDPIPEGTFMAVCYGVIDLGTHTNVKFNKDAHKIMLQWEIPEERITLEKDGQELDLPRAISKRYTNSLHQKAALRHDLEAWRGKRFTEEELKGFDISKIVGSSCYLGVVHEPGKDGKVYANISSIMAMPKKKGTPILTPENEMVVFAIEDDAEAGFDIPDNLPEWVVKLIQESKEWKGEMPYQREAVSMPEVVDATDIDREDDPEDDPEDDLPF